MLDAFVAPDIYPPAAPDRGRRHRRRGSAQLGWAASPETDVIGYRVYRGSSSTTRHPDRRHHRRPVTDPRTSTSGLQPGRHLPLPGHRARHRRATSRRPRPSSTATVAMNAVPAGTYEDDDTDDILAQRLLEQDHLDRRGHRQRRLLLHARTPTATPRCPSRPAASAGSPAPTAPPALADVYLDGVKETTVDLYSSTTKYAQNVYEVSGLPETGHTIRIVRTGNKNAASVGRNITLDALVAPDIYAPGAPTALKAAAIRTGAKLTWTKSPATDVASYRIFRRAAGSTTDVLVGTTSADTTSFADVGLADGASYTWTVVARDTSSNDSAAVARRGLHQRRRPVRRLPAALRLLPDRDRDGLDPRPAALGASPPATSGDGHPAQPGHLRRQLRRHHQGHRPTSRSGSAGPRTAVFDNADITKGYGFRVNGASNVVLAGMTVRNVQKGVAVINSKRRHRRRPPGREHRRRGHPPQEPDHRQHRHRQLDRHHGPQRPELRRGRLHRHRAGQLVPLQQLPAGRQRPQPRSPSTTSAAPPPSRSRPRPARTTAPCGRTPSTAPRSSPTDTDSLIQAMGNGWVIAGNIGSQHPGRRDPGLEHRHRLRPEQHRLRQRGRPAPSRATGSGCPTTTVGNVVGCDNTATRAALGMSNKTCQN